MSVYLDASILVAMFTADPHSNRARTFLRTQRPELVVSDFTAAELASVVARRVRTHELALDDARAAFAAFDAWTARAAQRATIRAADVTAATAFLRRLDLNLRTPDALHIAIAHRIGAAIATFDERMAASAAALETPVAAA